MSVRLNIILPRSRRARERTGAHHPLIWRWNIGHYGSYYVDVPAENFEAFKRRFPKGTFPRNVKLRPVTSTGDSRTAIRFDEFFPRSDGMFYQVKFGDRTLAEGILESGRILQDESAERPDLSD